MNKEWDKILCIDVLAGSRNDDADQVLVASVYTQPSLQRH